MIVPGSDGTSIQASLHLQPRHDSDTSSMTQVNTTGVGMLAHIS